jgi:hypothetical protein
MTKPKAMTKPGKIPQADRLALLAWPITVLIMGLHNAVGNYDDGDHLEDGEIEQVLELVRRYIAGDEAAIDAIYRIGEVLGEPDRDGKLSWSIETCADHTFDAYSGLERCDCWRCERCEHWQRSKCERCGHVQHGKGEPA